MREIITAIIILLLASSAIAQEVKYIDAPNFEGQIYLYGEPKSEDVEFEQWYEIQGRGQFVRNVKAPALIPYLPDPAKSNGAAIIIAPGGAFLHHTCAKPTAAAAMRLRNGG